MTKVNLGKDTSGRPLVLDDTTVAKIRWAEAQLGWTFTIIQGSYMAGIGASRSGGTHDAGGAVDLRTWDIPASTGVTRALTALREAGLIAWYRPQSAFPDHEIHALDYGDPNLSPAARSQVTAYLAGRNGLSGSLSGPDDGPKVTIPKQVPSGTVTPPEVPVATSYVIDISGAQKGLRIAALKEQGYSAVIIKCTEGHTYVNPYYAGWVAEAKAINLPVAAYHALWPTSIASQAKWLAKCIGDKSIPVMLDVEAMFGHPSWLNVTSFTAEATKRGVRVGMEYLPRSYWLQIGSPSLAGHDIVQAAYPTGQRGYGSVLYPGNGHPDWDSYGGATPLLWQFTSAGKIDGFDGNVDVSAFRGTEDELLATGMFKTWGAAPKPKPKPTPQPKDWFDMATPADLAAEIAKAIPAIAKAVEAELRVPVPPNETSWPGQKDVSYRATGQRVLGQLAELRAEVEALKTEVEALPKAAAE